MKTTMGRKLFFAGFMAASAVTATVAIAQKAEPNLLDSLGSGLWQLRAIGGGPTGAATDKYCVGNPKKLAQIQHVGLECSQFVVRSNPNSVTISYSCPNAGQGMTTIRKESAKLIQIDSQGIRNNSPFAFSVEARLTGPCGG